MDIAFYLSAFVTIIATIMVITRHNPVHALLYLVISLLSLSVIFALLGSPFAAVLEIIVYAGAIMVLFIFVVMLLNLGSETARQEKEWLQPKVWILPSILSLILLGELIYMVSLDGDNTYMVQIIDSKAVAISLFKPYVIGVELAAMLLMAGVVAAAHIGQQKKTELHRFLKEKDKE
jgi:NADH-quinone oxidoreductase subunit J